MPLDFASGNGASSAYVTFASFNLFKSFTLLGQPGRKENGIFRSQVFALEPGAATTHAIINPKEDLIALYSHSLYQSILALSVDH
jgi:hypothetical protein